MKRKTGKTGCKLLALLSALALCVEPHASMIQAEESMTFNYTGDVQEVTLDPGFYLFEVYGAQGGNGRNHGDVVINTGYGGYAKGEIEITETATLYIYVGGIGQDGSATVNTSALGGFNGGGNGGRDTNDDDGAGAGGGASDIRLIGGLWNEASSLRSRIIVAGGGSGATSLHTGQSGGAIDNKRNATQTDGYAFGIGSNGIDAGRFPGSGAGGGYYGGNLPDLIIDDTPDYDDYTDAGAGSSFISGHIGCDAVLEEGTHTGQPIHYSGLSFTNTVMQEGVQSGDGLVRITALFPDLYVLLDLDEIAQLSVTHHLPDNTAFIWTSTNQNSVIVDENGVVTAKGEGTSWIWAENLDGTFRESIPIRVIEGAEEMRLSLHLNAGESKRLAFGNDPTKVTWNAMNPSVATINANGHVTGIAHGLCIVRAELNGIEKFIYIRVNDISKY